DLELRLVDRVLVVGDIDLIDMAGAEQAPRMILQAEDGCADVCVVRTHTLEDGKAVMQGVGKDVGGGFAPRHEFTVVPDDTVAIRHGHRALPKMRLDCTKRRGLTIATFPE